MKRFAAALCLLLLLRAEVRGQESAAAGSPPRDWSTPGELRGWFAPTTPTEMSEYLVDLAESFDAVTLDTLTWVDGGSVEPDSALPVLLVRVRGQARADRERLRVLVLAGQRGDELAGTEVSLQMVRELVLGETGAWLEDLEMAFVPAVNPWGLLWWMPDEPSGIDPTLDHTLLRSPATQAIHDFASRWRPHMVLDLREMGPTVYRVQAGLPKHPNVDADLVRYGRFYLLPYVANELARISVTFREYVAVGPESNGLGTPLQGAEGLPQGMYLTPGQMGAKRARNALSLSGSLSIMLAVASTGGAEGLADRVQLLYRSLGFLLEVAAAQADGLLEREPTEPSVLAVRYAYERDEQHPDLAWLVWNDRGRIVQQKTDRWRSVVRPQLALPVPAAWVIESEGRDWAELVAAHGYSVERLRRDEHIEVGSYPVGTIATLPSSLTHDLALTEAADGSNLLVHGDRRFPQGSWIVRADQPGVRLLFTLIEPWSQDSPLGREAASTADFTEPRTYPVHRIEAGTSLGSLRTEPAELGAARAGAY